MTRRRHHRRAERRRASRRPSAPGAISAVDVVEQHLARIAAREGELHAFNLVLADEARAAAVAIDASVAAGEDPGPLAGVPVALKDNLCTRGIADDVLVAASSRVGGRRTTPPSSSGCAAAGAVVVGKTNLDEFAMGSLHRELRLRPDPQPARPQPRARRLVAAAARRRWPPASPPRALGSDTGGSIRQPAALCGVVGVKPTYGVVSRYGLVAFASSLDQIGPFAHTVDDAALLLEVIAGHDPLDSTSIPQPAPPSAATLRRRRRGPAHRPHHRPSGRRRPRRDGPPRGGVRRRSSGPARRSSTCTVPAFGYGLTAYYLIAPAEASSNLARYDGVRYGLRVDAAGHRGDERGHA